jgi:hypothetical protein
VLKRRKLHVPHLLQKFAQVLREESQSHNVFADTPKASERLKRHYKMCLNLLQLREIDANRFLILHQAPNEARRNNYDDNILMHGDDGSRPLMRIKRNLRRLERRQQPMEGWTVDAGQGTCECGYWRRSGICIHIMRVKSHLGIRIEGIISPTRRLVNRSVRRGRRQLIFLRRGNPIGRERGIGRALDLE